jgi:Ca2+-binding RTX toxin-like protein
VGSISNDTLTLTNNVSGLSVNLGNGNNNTLNLAAGANSFVNIGSVQHINGTAADDTLTVSNGLFEAGNNPIVDLGAGNNTLNLGFSGTFLSVLNVQHINGNGLDNFLGFNNNVSGVAVDLGAGINDNLTLANGSNSLSVSNVENVQSADWNGAASNDTLTLLNNVSGVSINLQQGFNTLNLTAGTNQFETIFNVDAIYGSGSDDSLVIDNGPYGPNNDTVFNLGGGNDTLTIGSPNSSFGLLGVEHLNGNAQDNYFGLTNTVSGLTVDLGGGNDTLGIAAGASSVAVTNVENINTGDYSGGAPTSNDTLTLTNTVNGLTVNLQEGSNTLNLAAGANAITAFNVQSINGTVSDDALTMLNDAGGDTIDLGAGNDTLNLAGGAGGVTVKNIENVNGSANNDFITIANSTNPTTVTGGGGMDFITASAGQDNLRYTNAAQSAAGGGADTVNNFDAANDTIVLDHVTGLAGQVHFVSNGIFSGSPGNFHSEARLNGNILQIDVDGDGQIGAGDMEIVLNGLNGTLTDANFVTTGVNHAPIDISLVGSSVTENSISGTVVGTLSGTDPDAGDTATFSLVNPNGLFAINGNNLVVAGAIDYEAAITQQVTVRVTDSGGLSYDKVFDISVTDVNDAPTVTSGSTGSVAENAAVSTVVYQATASDQDAAGPNSTITWSLTGTDATAFDIDANGQVTLKNPANYEAQSSYSINVVATDGGNLSSIKAVTIGVTNVNEAPTITSGATGSVAENAAPLAIVYHGMAVDPDVPGMPVTWSLSGADAAAFTIDAAGNVRLKGSANYEAQSSYSINVIATDTGFGNPSTSKAVTVNVTDVNEGPTVTSGATATVAENAATSTVVYQAMASDPDTTAPFKTITWSLAGTDSSAFSIDTSGHLTLNNSANYEAKTAYSLNVIATDGGSLSSTKAVTVSVTNVNEAPTDISVSNTMVQQSTVGGTVVGALSAIDPDAVDTATFSLVDGANNQFNVVNGNIVVAGPLTAGPQQVIVQVADALGLTVNKTFTINVYSGATVVGDANANTLTGTSGDDLIQGLGGNDRLQGLAGNDILDGGTGFDRAVYTDAGAGGITVNLAAGTVSGAGVGNDTLIGVEGIVGSELADTYDATGFAGDTFVAGTNIGFNEFEGRGGADTITSAVNSQGALLTRISYANAATGVTVNLAAHTVSGGDGNDTLIGSGFAGIVGSASVDQLIGSSNAAGTVEVFEGRAGNDTIDGGGGFDRADYAQDPAAQGVGITVNLAIGKVFGDATTVGTDTLFSVESVRGTNSVDTFDATNFSGTSTNVGSNGTFNEFNGMGGDDNIIGNFNTRVTYINATGGVIVDLQTGATPGTGTADGDASTDHDTFSGVNAVQASMFNDILRGSNSTTVNETFYGGAGNDLIDGRGGFDIATYNNIYFSTGAITVNFAAGTVTGDASVGNDTLRSIEAVQGTNFNDVFVATNFGATGFLNTSLNNVGNNGTFNQFEGIGGNDTITGNGNTRIIYSSAADAVTINMQAGTASGGSSIGNDTFVGVNSATGSSLNDTYNAAGFTGITSAGSFGTFNLFEGLAGADTITGNGNTRVSYSQAGGGGVNVNLATGVVSGAAGADVINGGVNSVQGSNQNDTLTGGAGNETFFGGGGGDIINAGDGNNGITGQGGDDTIIGGAGTDVAFFTGAQDGGGYTITPLAGQIQVVDSQGAARDGTDVLSNVEVLQFSDVIMLLSSGTGGSPIDISTQGISGTGTVMGTTGDDFLKVGNNIFGHQINLGGGTDTVILSGGGYTLNLVGVENLTGSSGDDFVNLTTNANGLVVDLGAGTNDNLNLAGGTNTLSIAGVESIGGSDFGATPGVNDVLNLLSTVSGLNISLGNGDNTMNLAASANSFTNIFDINHVMGTTGDDTLTVTGAISAANGTTVDLGGGDDTLVLAGYFAVFSAVGIEHINGSSSDNAVNLTNNVSGIAINLGLGNDAVSLANGTNSLSITGVENLNASDFTGGLHPSDDTITLLNTVSGVTVNMGEGTANVLNLAAGSNSFDNLFNVNLINGSASNDTLTLQANPANTIDLGDGNDTVTFNSNVFDITVANVENINGSANFDRITISNTALGSTTITAGAGADEVTASAGHDNFRFTSIADSAAGAADTIHNFDAANDSFTFSGITIVGGSIEYVDSAAFLGGGHASAHLQDFGGGNNLVQIDTNGDGTSDMDISLQNFTGTLHNGNFLLT